MRNEYIKFKLCSCWVKVLFQRGVSAILGECLKIILYEYLLFFTLHIYIFTCSENDIFQKVNRLGK